MEHPRVFVLALSLFLAGVLAGCDSNEEEGLSEVAGYALRIGGEEVARYLGGEATGAVTVKAGEETGLIEMYFLDRSGDVLSLASIDIDIVPEIFLADADVAEAVRLERDLFAFPRGIGVLVQHL